MKQNNNNNNNNIAVKSPDFFQNNNPIKKKKNAFETVHDIQNKIEKLSLKHFPQWNHKRKFLQGKFFI